VVVPTQPNSNSNSNSVHGSIERRQHNHTSITSAVQNDPVPLPPLPLDPNGKTLAQNIQSGRSMISTTATAVAAPPTRPPDEAYFDQLLPSTEHTNALGDVTTLVEQPPEEKHVPSFSLSGALAQDETTGNMINGVVLKYSEPVEARLPTRMYRVYVFKNGKQVDVYHIHRQSFFLFGRDRTVVHVPVDHPSSSSQHAVIQYRFVNGHVKPYIIDIESTNGTLLNGKKIESARYYELKETDMIQFGTSVREYVLVDAGEKKDE
jgi:smad nuclear-interacting protein 1